jgi:hypothetical protein
MPRSARTDRRITRLERAVEQRVCHARTRRLIRGLSTVLLAVASLAAVPAAAAADEPQQQQKTSSVKRAASVPVFLGGAALALGAHEGGHLLFDGIFDAHPRLEKVSFHGIPFFAITHDASLSHRKEFVIDSAGFWVQQTTNEVLLSSRPRLRQTAGPLVKGMFAFNVIASVAYAGAAFARTGPVERDTRGMADALRWKEPLIGALILAPAVLDAIRYYHPGAEWAKWGSRGVKAGMFVLVIR